MKSILLAAALVAVSMVASATELPHSWTVDGITCSAEKAPAMPRVVLIKAKRKDLAVGFYDGVHVLTKTPEHGAPDDKHLVLACIRAKGFEAAFKQLTGSQ